MNQTANPSRMHFIAQGKGPPVILIHGMAASSAGWFKLMPALISAGYRVYALDLLGHGDSYKPSHPDHYHLKEIYQALEDWFTSQAIQEPIYMVGHSLGGYLCLEYHLKHPDIVRAMALIDPLYSPNQLLPGINFLTRFPQLGVKALRDYYPKMVPALSMVDAPLSGNFSPDVRRQMLIDLRRAAPEILHILSSVPDLTGSLSQVQVTSLIVYGSRDVSLRPSSFPRMANLMQAASLVKITGVGHQPHLARPELVNRFILDFFDRNR